MKSEKYVEKKLKKHFKKAEQSVKLPVITKELEGDQTVRLYRSRRNPLVSAAAFAVYIVGIASMIGLFVFVGKGSSTVDPGSLPNNNAGAALPGSTVIYSTDPAADYSTEPDSTTPPQDPADPANTDPAQSPADPAETDTPVATPPTVTPPKDSFDALFHSYKEIDDLDAYKESHTNLMEEYFDKFEEDYSVVNEGHWHMTGDKEYFCDPSELFDGDLETKWDDATEYVEECSSIVWSMTEAVDVSAFSITTADTNSIFIGRNPVKWRLYGANELPADRMDSAVGNKKSYFETQTVPEGWELIDAVEAFEGENTIRSAIPDLDCYEAAMEVQNPGSYKYFMLLIDWCDARTGLVAISELTLYGSAD